VNANALSGVPKDASPGFGIEGVAMRDGLMSRCMLVAAGALSLAIAARFLKAEDAPPAKPVAPPITLPTARPISDARVIQQLFSDLASADGSKRDAARVALMGLRRSQLGLLRDAVKRSLPIAPSQRAVLELIVTHVVLADDPYPTTPGGFLGIRLPSSGSMEERPLLAMDRGVVVISRIPGFCSFRLLEDGDIIVGIAEESDDPIDSPRDLIMAVTKAAAGKTLTFEVIRRAELVRIPITLDAKPDFNVQIPDLNAFENARAQTAEQVWNNEFAPLLKDSETVG